MKTEALARIKQKVDSQAIKTYNQTGVLYIPNLLSAKEIKRLENGIELNLQNLSTMAKVASPESDTGLFIEDFCIWQDNPYYKQIIFDSPLAAIAGLLMQSKQVRLYHDHILVKEPYTQNVTPWHQDLPYYNINGMQTCIFWIPIDPVSRESTLEFISGSHLGALYTPRTFKDNQAQCLAEGILDELPTDAELRQSNEILGWKMKPGEIIIFNMLTLHASKGVPSNQRRRVLSLRFMGDDTRFAPLAWKTSPDFPGLNERLKAGSKMEDELLPLVYQQNN